MKFEYKALAPNYKLINKLKDKSINEEIFILSYNEQLNELNPTSVYEHIKLLTGNFEPVLMCHCAKTKFCHRHLVADWLEKELKINITEYNVPNFKRIKGYLIKNKQHSLFTENEIST